MAAVSLESCHVVEVSQSIRNILSESDISEFKWKKLGGAKYRFGANKLIDFVLDLLVPLGARVDVLVWDTHDERHSVPNRDETKNDERMFFHLHKQLMCRRPAGRGWHLRPDQRVDMDWNTVRECLGCVGRWRKHFSANLIDDEFSERFFEVRTLEEVQSHKAPLCQIADLFAGMGCFSRGKAGQFKAFFDSRQRDLFSGGDSVKFSNTEVERFEVIQRLYERCRDKRLGVSLRSNGYLATMQPANPLNFWHYEPKHELDKAPSRNG